MLGDLNEHLAVCQHSVVPCPFDGCRDAVRAPELEAHKVACHRRPIVCTDCGKSVTLMRHQGREQALKRHQGNGTRGCPEFTVPCPHGCGASMARKLIGYEPVTWGRMAAECACTEEDERRGTKCDAEHHLTGHIRTCPKMRLSCEFARIGCDVDKMPREELQDHLNSHAAAHATLCRRELKRVADAVR